MGGGTKVIPSYEPPLREATKKFFLMVGSLRGGGGGLVKAGPLKKKLFLRLSFSKLQLSGGLQCSRNLNNAALRQFTVCPVRFDFVYTSFVVFLHTKGSRKNIEVRIIC